MGRRRRGSGTVYKRKEGRYEAACWVNTPLGIKRVRRYAKTRNEAEAILVEMRKKHDNGIKVDAREAKLGLYMDYWLLKVKTSIRRSTHCSYETTVRLYLKPGLGHKGLAKLSVDDVQSFIDSQLHAGQSRRNVQKMKIVLSSILNHAMYEERIIRNVARSVKLPSYKPNEVEPWSLAQLATFLDAVVDHPFFPVYFLMGFYGLRTGEALGISWRDIDMNNKIIRIHKQVEYVDGSYGYAELKTDAGRRQLPIVNTTFTVLSSLQSTPHGPLPDLVFKTPSGLPIDHSNLRKTFKRLSKNAGLPVINPHHLRHTAATNLKNLQIAPRDVQSILGHAHISTTMQIYQHADMAGKSEAFEKYELQIAEKSASSRQIKPSNEKVIAQNNDSYSGTPSWVRTSDLRLRSPLLYPTELPGQKCSKSDKD